jgi:peptidoglycan-associated lipoprotein
LNIKQVNILFFFLSILILQFHLVSCGTKSRLTTADKKFEAGEFASAAELYSRVYSKISYKEADLRARVAFNQAESLRKLNYTRAENMYYRAVRTNFKDIIFYIRQAQAQHRKSK